MSECIFYGVALSFQLAGALILLIYGLSTKRENLVRNFARGTLIKRDGTTKKIHHKQDKFQESCKEVYLNKAAFIFLAVGYGTGIFGKGPSLFREKIILAGLVIIATILIIGITKVTVEKIIKSSQKTNDPITDEELKKLRIKADLESISNEDIDRIMKQE